MKNITMIFMMLLVSFSFAQNHPIDFEPDGYGADWNWTVFENLNNPPLEIIDNPDPSGINTSATVAKFTALEGGQPWAGVESQHGVDLGTFEWNDDNRIVTIQVWKPVISNVGIKFATETGWAEAEILVSNTVTNQWEELTFDFSNAINPPDGNGILGQIIIFPDFDMDGREQDNVIYFDNVTFHPLDDDPPADGPEVAAPSPPALDPDDVISIFSDAFANVGGTDFNPPWGQSTQVSIIDIQGSSTLKYANFNYQGTQFASPLDVTEMGFIHLDMWTADATSVNFFIISPGPVETAFSLPITPNQWVSYEIPLSAFAPVDLTDVIQFKFDGGDGTQTIYLDNLYFFTTEVEEGSDATLSDLQVDGTTVDGFSPSILNYSVVLPEGTTEVPTVTVTTNDPDASAAITPADAVPGTTSILVTSANTEVELTYNVTFSVEEEEAEPTVPAPTPPSLNPNQVISIFSDAFENVPGTDFFPDWGQTTVPSIIEIEGVQTLKYANFNYQGTQFAGALDVSQMEYLHLHMWTADATEVNVFCISEGPVETAFSLPITPNQWVSYEIPLSEFAPVDLTDVIQFKFDGGDGTQTIYLDNLYFFTTEVEEGSDATLSDLQVDGTTVDGFSPSILNYSVVLPEGTTEIPTVTVTTNDPDASAEITPADAIPGTTSILVTSANTEVELTYTVAFSVETEVTEPTVAAPTPPERNPEDVISIFSDAYENLPDTDFFPWWDQTTEPSIIEIEGSQTLKYANFNYQGIQLANANDVSAMEYLHLDMWTADATSVNFFIISPGPVETAFSLPITPNQWVSYEIPLSAFAPVDLTDVIQFKFDGGDGTQTIYLDNLYFYRIPTSVSEIDSDELTVYPNPVRSGDLVTLSIQAKQIDVYDISGRLIQSFANTSSVETDKMKRGVYLMRVQSENGHVQISRLIVK